jgi:recombination protein RecA
MGDAQMGLQARLMSQAMRKLTAIIGKSRTILIFINQIRMKIGVMFGNPETTTGGNALKFYASVRLEVRKTETIEGGKDSDAIGNRVRVKVVKNKVAPPFRRAEMEIMFGKGVSAIGSLLDAAVKYNIIDKKGAWFSYGEEKVGQGRESAKEYLDQNPAFTKEVEAKLRKIMFPGREFPEPAKSAPQGTPRPAGVIPEAGASAGIPAGMGQPAAAQSAAAPAVGQGRAGATSTVGRPETAGPGNIPPAGELPRGPGRPRKTAGPATEPEGLF